MADAPRLQRLIGSLKRSAGTIVFGMEDGTVSIFGLVFGVAATTSNRRAEAHPPGVHPHLRAIPPGHLPAPAEESHRPHAGDPAAAQGRAAAAIAMCGGAG